MTDDSRYIHGSEPEEQERLALLNGLLNTASLRALGLRPGYRVLDVGSGLGLMARAMAREVGGSGIVVGIERDEAQLARSLELADSDGEPNRVDFRAGSIFDPPLAEDEWGTFDVVHARFVLEHLTEPQRALEIMARAVRPGGRLVVEDDDHALLELWPPAPAVDRLWTAYWTSYEHLGNDPRIGRRLVAMLAETGLTPRRNDMPFFGSCQGSPIFDAMIDNFVGIMEGARATMLEADLASEAEIDAGFAELARWRQRPEAALWYMTCWAEAVRPGPTAETEPADAAVSLSPSRPDRPSALEFLVDSARDLSSTLELDEVFERIAQRVLGLLDAHLVCIMLWSEERQLLEHSYSLKFGRHVPQEGGFPLGHGLSGSAARDLQPIRVANVLEDPRYVRFRHAEVEVRSELAVPLVADGKLIGVLDLESTQLAAFSHEDEQIVGALAFHMASALENARLYETIRTKEQRLERELSTARRVQESLLPAEVPRVAGLELGTFRAPARELSGDFYDFFPAEWGGVAFCLGDVAGKGTGAALLASVAVGALRGHVLRHWERPRDVLAELNEQLHGIELDHRFVALTLAVFDPTDRTLRLSSAGMPAPLRITSSAAIPIELPGVPLGGLGSQSYGEATVPLEAGDVVVFYSDGVEEAVGSDGSIFGVDGIESTVRFKLGASAPEIARAIVEASAGSVGSDTRGNDDRTVIVLRVDADAS